MIDFHVHLAGTGCCQSGVELSQKFQRRPTFLALRFMQGISKEQMVSDIDEVWIKRVDNFVAESKHVTRAVVLCLDHVYSEAGEKEPQLTQLHVPNSWGRHACSLGKGHLLLGASVHPYRPDALEALEEAKSLGAVLIKWLPSVMGIDPAHPRCFPFYDRLRELRLPLLSHTAAEHTFASIGPEWLDKNHVRRLRVPLERGVTVVAAHAGTPTQTGELSSLAEEFPRLWADSSGLFNFSRARSAISLCENPLALRDRLLFATDWPIPTMPSLVADRIGVSGYRRIMKLANPFDRDAELKEMLGFPLIKFHENESRFLETSQCLA